jgi:phenylpropionate dioxygenase-like ring-hydroxylating dioxygenase large terminal subunit
MFLQDCWYVAAFAAELVAGQPLARRICNKPVVIYRTAAGAPVALEDRCIHRGMPLSLGATCDGDNIRCPYHGFVYGPTGSCVAIPSQKIVPPGAAIRSYPIIEKDAIIWVWVGNPARADPALIVDHSYHVDPTWDFAVTKFEVAASYDLIIDNLLDLTHVAFVHKAVLQADVATQLNVNAPVRRLGDRGLATVRHMPDSEAPLQYQRAHTFRGNIDRWQETEFRPGIVTIYSGGMDVGTGAFTGKREGGVHLRTLHAITPVTSNSCTYHFSIAKNFRLGEPELLQLMLAGGIATVNEDIPILEAQQLRIAETGDSGFVSIAADAAQLQARRIHRALLKFQEETITGDNSPTPTVAASKWPGEETWGGLQS